MPKPETRRAEISERLADHILANGLSGSSLRPLARAAGTSDRMLLYYFADKADMIGAALGVVAQRMVVLMAANKAPEPMPVAVLQPLLFDTILSDEMWPYMRVWMEMASLAAQGDGFYRMVGEQIGRGFLAWGAAQIDSPTPAQREADAARLLIMAEGAMLLKSIGMDDVRHKL
jgi:AcrR family transcriptional regulator